MFKIFQKKRTVDISETILHFSTLLSDQFVSLSSWLMSQPRGARNGPVWERTQAKLSLCANTLKTIRKEKEACTLSRLTTILMNMMLEYQIYCNLKGYSPVFSEDPQMSAITLAMYDKLASCIPMFEERVPNIPKCTCPHASAPLRANNKSG